MGACPFNSPAAPACYVLRGSTALWAVAVPDRSPPRPIGQTLDAALFCVACLRQGRVAHTLRQCVPSVAHADAPYRFTARIQKQDVSPW